MDEQRLAKLKERAAKATQIAETIAALQEANPYKSVTLKFQNWNTGDDLLDERLLKEVIEVGRNELIARLENDLESLIKTEPDPESVSSKETFEWPEQAHCAAQLP